MRNVILIILDSCRYDAFMEAQAVALKSFGQVLKCYSAACWTLPSMVSLLYGRPPLNSFIKGKLFEVSDFINKQILTPNPLIIQAKNTIFREFKIKGLEYDYLKSSADIFKDAKEFLDAASGPFLLVLHLMETHTPYFDGQRTYQGARAFKNPSEGVKIQSKCVDFIDNNFQRHLYKAICQLKNTRIIITSDHGDGFGEEECGIKNFQHDPANQYLVFHPKLFEIPFIIKDL